jgi:hypothetical protein
MPLPFNRFSIAPSYKWVKVYAGYTSMQFSPYSLAGHELFGGGVELSPDNGFKISALFGRLKKASNGDDGAERAYRRMGGGYQRNNLNRQKSSTTSRMIYSGNIAANVTEKLNVSANFSNVQSYLYINDVYSQVTQTNEFQNLDTLNVTQLNYSVGLNSSYLLQSTKEQRQNLNLSFTYQKSAEAQQYSSFVGNDIYNLSLSYRFSLLPLKLNLSAAATYNYNQAPDNAYTQAITYNLSMQKTFFGDLRSALTATYSDMSSQSMKLSKALNLRLSESYAFAKRHNLNLSLAMVYSKAVAKARLQYSGNLSYSYAFSMTLTRKDKKLQWNGIF